MGFKLLTALLLSGCFIGAVDVLARTKHPLWEAPMESNNLFLNKKVTSSGHWRNKYPRFAVNGKSKDANEHWACENFPGSLTVDMGTCKKINTVKLWNYFGHKRRYSFVIEGSKNKRDWDILVDCRDKLVLAKKEGSTFIFPAQEVRFVKVTITKNSAGQKKGGHIVEVAGFIGRKTQKIK